MAKIKWLQKIDYQELLKGLLISAIILLIPILAYIFKAREDNIWWTTFVTQLGIGLLWMFLRLGLFDSRRSQGNKFKEIRKRQRQQKLGLELEKQKIIKTPIEQASKKSEKKVKKNWTGIIFILLLAIIYLIVAVVITYG